MAYVLSLGPHHPIKRSFSENHYLQSRPPTKEPFLGPLGDITARNTSACSLYTLGSNKSNIWKLGNENTPPLTSQSLLNLVPETQGYDFVAQHVEHGPRKRNFGAIGAPSSLSRTTNPSNPFSRKSKQLQHVTESSSGTESSAEYVHVDDSHTEESDLFNLYEAIHASPPEERFSDNTGSERQDVQGSPQESLPTEPQPFRRWMSALRRRHIQRRKKPEMSIDGAGQVLVVGSPQSNLTGLERRTSESMTSSMGFVTTVKTTSITIASTSIAPTSERMPRNRMRLGNRSSNTDVRRSTDSHRGGLGPVIDESAWLRSLQRRKVVEELIASEESYIADLKVLINVSQLPIRPACAG